MKPLLSLLRTVYCRNTHHFFALDAIPLVATDSGKRLSRLLLRYPDHYLRGATDPDFRFRDYQNHVVHVSEGYWGGAPRVAQQWCDRLMKYLRTQRWADAAHAAGVLSHYFTDPLQPLHTAHGDRERVLHQPIEWSIQAAYRSIFKDWQRGELQVVFQLAEDPGWLGEAILHGARFANQKYDLLIDHYDLQKSVDNPAAALGDPARSALTELVGLTVTGWARVLERIARSAEQTRGEPLPAFTLWKPLVAATIKMPFRLWGNRIESKWLHDERESLVEEYQRTGQLRRHLPAEVDIVHRVVKIYHDELRWKQERQRRLESRQTVTRVDKPVEQPVNTTIEAPYRRAA
ncbi:zinc dependent phospholipase C family protein [Novipirellula caenicola]|uniref:Phospholipase C/D domain-containing protein n=1 Tax=Novipirellula caenicola TaxID=1536901 RepID=A0ABP9VQ24_9BACT